MTRNDLHRYAHFFSYLDACGFIQNTFGKLLPVFVNTCLREAWCRAAMTTMFMEFPFCFGPEIASKLQVKLYRGIHCDSEYLNFTLNLCWILFKFADHFAHKSGSFGDHTRIVHVQVNG